MAQIVRTHLPVNAPIDAVWQTLTLLERYRAWNPFITSARGDVTLGARLELTIEGPGGRRLQLKPWVTAVEPPHYVEWLNRLAVPGVLDGRHSFTLTRMAGARTLLQQSGTFTGALVPASGALFTRARASFLAMNEALASEVARAHHDGNPSPL